VLTSYVLTNIAVIVLRESRLSNYQPTFKAPFYPWLQLFSVLLFTFFVVDLGTQATEISLGFIFVCFCIYFFYGRKQKRGEYALLHLLKRITDKRLTDDLLEDELREIVVNRDHIEQDDFDQLVRTATIIDLPRRVSFDELLILVAADIATETGMSAEEVISRFRQRNAEISTVVSDFLALPHIIVDGEDHLFLWIIRAREGVWFSDQEDDVKAVFLIGGTSDRRVLHLRTIASIATLVSQQGFQEEWLSVEGTTELKNLMMLSGRIRFRRSDGEDGL
jgi:mannitol/fructose-specific phosphotransferase system IIA component (Ntr-type)